MVAPVSLVMNQHLQPFDHRPHGPDTQRRRGFSPGCSTVILPNHDPVEVRRYLKPENSRLFEGHTEVVISYQLHTGFKVHISVRETVSQEPQELTHVAWNDVFALTPFEQPLHKRPRVIVERDLPKHVVLKQCLVAKNDDLEHGREQGGGAIGNRPFSASQVSPRLVDDPIHKHSCRMIVGGTRVHQAASFKRSVLPGK